MAVGGAALVTLLTFAGALGMGPGAMGATAGPTNSSSLGPSGAASPPPATSSKTGNWLTIDKKPSSTSTTAPTQTSPTTAGPTTGAATSWSPATSPTTPGSATTGPTATDPATGPTTGPDTGQSAAAVPALPAKSGTGRRIVYDISAQRVWLVAGNNQVIRSYLVSGSTDPQLLGPGTYTVSSSSRRSSATSGKDSMHYFVGFTRGNGYLLGFHDIAVRPDGTPVESRSDLGTFGATPGITQWASDAKALWDFASAGTPVVVTA